MLVYAFNYKHHKTVLISHYFYQLSISLAFFFHKFCFEPKIQDVVFMTTRYFDSFRDYWQRFGPL